MARRWFLNLFAVLTLAALLPVAAAAAGTTDKPKPKPPAPKAPKSPNKPKLPPGTITTHALRVQIRHPHWKTFAVTNPAVGVRTAAVLKAQGWHVRLKRTSLSNVVRVQGRMPHWRTRAMTRNRIIAQRMVAVLHHQHFQARIR